MKNFIKLWGFPLLMSALVTTALSGCGGGQGLVFTLQVQVVGSGTVTSNPAGIDCESDCSEDYIVGTEVELTAVADPGFRFTGWSGGGCSGTGLCTVTMDSDLQVTATFAVQIAFTSLADAQGNNSGVTNIWVINLDGSGLLPLTQLTNPGTDSFTPQWSPDNTKILFSSTRALNGDDAANTNGTENIWVMNGDGSNPTPLTLLTANDTDCRDPRWSPDGSKITFQSIRALDGSNDTNIPNQTSNIWVMNADGTNQAPLTDITGMGADSFGPQWSPDGSQIVFRSSRDLDPMVDGPNLPNFTNNIWVVDNDGSDPIPLTMLMNGGANCAKPQWSPDGMQIAFESTRDLNPAIDGPNVDFVSNIWIMDSDGSNQMPLSTLTFMGAHSFSPRWSHDSSQITFQSRGALNGTNAANDVFNVWIMDSNGQNTQPLTLLISAFQGTTDPVFSADDNKITFASDGALDGGNGPNVNDTDNIFVINPDGTGISSLTKSTISGADSFEPEFTN